MNNVVNSRIATHTRLDRYSSALPSEGLIVITAMQYSGVHSRLIVASVGFNYWNRLNTFATMFAVPG